MKIAENEHVQGSDHSTDLTNEAVAEISGVLRQLLADVFALYLKTKNFHWHASRPSPKPTLPKTSRESMC